MDWSCNFGRNSWFDVWLGFLMPYIIKDENGETMRIVGRQEEAKQIVQARIGWTFKRIMQKIIKQDGYSEAILLGDALI